MYFRILYWVAVVTLTGCSQKLLYSTNIEPIKQSIAELGFLWQKGDCDSINAILSKLDYEYHECPEVLILRMSFSLVCERNLSRFYEHKGNFDKVVSKIKDGDSTRRFVNENAGFDSWIAILDDDEQFSAACRMHRVMGENRFPAGEVALWVCLHGSLSD